VEVNFASDNNSGVCPEVMAALAEEAERFDAAYGLDQASARLEAKMADVFERPVGVFPVATGTAANSLALAVTNPPWGGVVCHADAHIQVDECAAPTVIGSGLTLHPVAGAHGKLTPDAVSRHLDTRRDSGVHTVPITGLSLTNSTEAGTRYTTAELGALSELAHRRGMRVHLDGARFANAVAGAGSSPAELTWGAGVDIMSFGATKGGALAAEAIVVFADDLLDSGTESIERLRKRVGHLLSKQRFASAQFNAWLGDGVWLGRADHANDLARRLGEGLADAGVELAHPVETNMVFALLDPATNAAARAAGATYYTESTPDERVEARLVTSWSSRLADVEALIDAVAGA